jgi:hypothetical protein
MLKSTGIWEGMLFLADGRFCISELGLVGGRLLDIL